MQKCFAGDVKPTNIKHLKYIGCIRKLSQEANKASNLRELGKKGFPKIYLGKLHNDATKEAIQGIFSLKLYQETISGSYIYQEAISGSSPGKAS